MMIISNNYNYNYNNYLSDRRWCRRDHLQKNKHYSRASTYNNNNKSCSKAWSQRTGGESLAGSELHHFPAAAINTEHGGRDRTRAPRNIAYTYDEQERWQNPIAAIVHFRSQIYTLSFMTRIHLNEHGRDYDIHREKKTGIIYSELSHCLPSFQSIKWDDGITFNFQWLRTCNIANALSSSTTSAAREEKYNHDDDDDDAK